MTRPPGVVIIGASFAGLFAAAAASAAGRRVTLVERDVLLDDAEPRHGVPQGRQPHVLLQRGLLAAQRLVPGFEPDALAAGAHRLDTGTLPWLGAYGWMPSNHQTYQILSVGRPLLELLLRRRVLALPGVELADGVRVAGLQRSGGRWQVRLADGGSLAADVVVDASGRSSRLPHWLAGLRYPVPPTTTVEAQLGYATRRYREVTPVDLPTGVVITATPGRPLGGTALPIEGGRWLLVAAGYGSLRPDRDEAAFDRALASVRDPALAELAARLEPETDVALYRQTGNQRHGYARRGPWPEGLLVVGDALCAFNPIYGQGITVAACQAEVLRSALGRDPARRTRHWQRRLGAVADFPWSVATGEDSRYVTADARQAPFERLIGQWGTRMTRLAVAGDPACLATFARVYHLIGSPAEMFAPAVVRAVLRSLVRGVPPPSPRPAVLADAGLRPAGRAAGTPRGPSPR